MNRFLAAPLALILTCFCLPAANAPGYKNFGVAVYVRAYEVREMKDLKLLEARWSAIEKQIKVSKVYLEVHRDGIIPDEEALATAKKFFADRGIQTSGGIATVAAERNRFQTFCYIDPAERAKFKQIVEYAARHFDEIILDDFFFTSCKSEAAIQAKGDKSWTRYRLDLMEDVAKNLVVAPARAVNPKVKLIIKYPNWYEHYQYLGYNVEAEPKLFDKVYTGTETRDAVYSNQHLQPYLGYDLVRWLDNVKPGANGGGWVDPGGARTLNRYAEQLGITLFAKAPEITLFDYRSLLEPIRQEDGSVVPATEIGRVAGYTFEQVDGFIGKLGHPVGVKSYKPFHSSGEDFLHDYLGMLGIPIDMVSEFPADAKVILLTETGQVRSRHRRPRSSSSLSAGKSRRHHLGPAARAARQGHRGHRRGRVHGPESRRPRFLELLHAAQRQRRHPGAADPLSHQRRLGGGLRPLAGQRLPDPAAGGLRRRLALRADDSRQHSRPLQPAGGGAEPDPRSALTRAAGAVEGPPQVSLYRLRQQHVHRAVVSRPLRRAAHRRRQEVREAERPQVRRRRFLPATAPADPWQQRGVRHLRRPEQLSRLPTGRSEEIAA